MLPKSYDIVLGNPPFIATGNMQSRDQLGKRFTTAQGRYDYSHLFVELAIRRLAPNGVLGLVVPNRLFRNRDAGPVRQVLTAEMDLQGLIDFGANEVFKATSAYIGAVSARKRRSADSPRPASVRAVLVSNVAETRYLGGRLLDALRSTEEYENDVLVAFSIAHPSGSRAWVLLPRSALRARIRLEEESVPLAEVAETFQGIRTGANDVFIMRIESTDGPLARVVNRLGDSAVVETALLHPVVFGSDIQRYDSLRPGQVLLYPYLHGTVISEPDLRESYPKTFEYLLSYQDVLSRRSSIAASGLRWYEIVRKRDEEWLLRRKLLTRDLATRTSFALDDDGQILLVGGTAVVPFESEFLLPLLAYLNSKLASEYLSQLTPAFRGAFQKFEPQHINQLPIPNFLLNDSDLGGQLGVLAERVLRARALGQEELGREAESEIDLLLERAMSAGEQDS